VLPCLLAVAAACGGGGGTPASPAPVRWTLSGTVSDAGTQGGLPGARVEIVNGPNQGRSAAADAQGRYTLAALEPGTFGIRALAEGFDPESRQVMLASNLTADFSLRKAGPPPQPGTGIKATVTDGLSDRALPDVLMRIDGLGETRTGADGTFQFEAAEPGQIRLTTLTSTGTVDRQTHLRVPGPESTLSLMPASLDLAAFDQMFRASGSLVRWVSAPAVVVERRVLQFTTVSDQSYTATPDLMTETEVDELVADLAWALPQLTAFGGFAGEQRQTAAAGDRVAVSRQGTIVVARYAGLQAATGYWGYGRWQTSNGEVRAGIIMLDSGFDTSGSPYRRSLRAHELGHALGYNHVTVRASVMNSSAVVEPNPVDRDGVKLAFQRPPLNRSPDTDPDPYTPNLRALAEWVWHGAR
jgi:hypothetical protein